MDCPTMCESVVLDQLVVPVCVGPPLAVNLDFLYLVTLFEYLLLEFSLCDLVIESRDSNGRGIAKPSRITCWARRAG